MTERSRARALISAAGLFFLVGLLVVAWNIPLPLGAYSPGPVTDAVDSVIIDGHPTYEGGGELIMLTAAWQEINAFEALIAAADPSVDVIARTLVRRPDESKEEYRRRILEDMDESTARSISAALSRVEVEEDLKAFVVGYAAPTPAVDVLDIGDQIVAVDEEPVQVSEQVVEALEGRIPGDVVTMEVVRDGERSTYEVELAAREEDPERAWLGIRVRDFPFWVDVDPGIVGGPSAGMMHTLAIIEALTPTSLTHGKVVAGTGTITAEGEVGAVGAIRQKVVGAEAAGAEYMLVPESNYETALTAPRRELELVPVHTVDDALEFLAGLGDG